MSSAVGVAQLVERRTVAPNVVGSNPISHPKPFFDDQAKDCAVCRETRK